MRLASICLWFHRDDKLMVCTNFTWFIDGALVLDPLRVIIIVGSDLLVAWHCLDIFFGALEFKHKDERVLEGIRDNNVSSSAQGICIWQNLKLEIKI